MPADEIVFLGGARTPFGTFLGTLREHCIRPEIADLACDAKRHQRVEDRAVEHPRSHAPDESEAPVISTPARIGCEHADVELLRQGVELLLERRRERQRIAHPPDHEKPPLHRRAACVSSSSMRVKTASSV